MRPILLKGHDGPLTCVKYNKDGDLLFTTCKRGKICLWYSDDGERIGTYNKHNGAVMYVDVNCKLNDKMSCSVHTSLILLTYNRQSDVINWPRPLWMPQQDSGMLRLAR